MLFCLLGGVGITLVLSTLPWFARMSMTQRLMPYNGAGPAAKTYLSLRDVVLPAFSAMALRIAGSLGVGTDVEMRLRRADFDGDVTRFRMRQLAAAGAGLCVGLLATVAVRPPPLLSFVMVIAPALLGFLVVEQHIVTRAQKRQVAVFGELPMIAEQLAMLLGAGYSVGAAISRLAGRSSGPSSRDLEAVGERVRHGVSIDQALGEWADLIDIPELRRLVEVLSLGGETSDLGSLVASEAKSFRAEAQRRLIEHMERRAQQVWVPVTVATLVPGVIFLAIPFLQALEMFSGT